MDISKQGRMQTGIVDSSASAAIVSFSKPDQARQGQQSQGQENQQAQRRQASQGQRLHVAPKVNPSQQSQQSQHDGSATANHHNAVMAPPLVMMQTHLNHMLYRISLVFRDPEGMQERRDAWHERYTDLNVAYQRVADSIEDDLAHAKHIIRGQYALFLDSRKRKLQQLKQEEELKNRAEKAARAEAQAQAQAQKEIIMMDASDNIPVPEPFFEEPQGIKTGAHGIDGTRPDAKQTTQSQSPAEEQSWEKLESQQSQEQQTEEESIDFGSLFDSLAESYQSQHQQDERLVSTKAPSAIDVTSVNPQPAPEQSISSTFSIVFPAPRGVVGAPKPHVSLPAFVTPTAHTLVGLNTPPVDAASSLNNLTSTPNAAMLSSLNEQEQAQQSKDAGTTDNTKDPLLDFGALDSAEISDQIASQRHGTELANVFGDSLEDMDFSFVTDAAATLEFDDWPSGFQ